MWLDRPLGFHNFRVGPNDTIIRKYHKSKTDKTGEHLSVKNIFANHKDYKRCWWTGFSVWCALNAEQLGNHKLLFLDPSQKYGTAAKKYCEQLTDLVQSHLETVANLMRADRFNPYGLRKGAATSAVCGTTAPPSLPTIARRGEWSLGAVLDVYWHFSQVGDEYLGRILAGLDPNSVEFGTLPPHWKIVDPLSNGYVLEAMKQLYHPIIKIGSENWKTEPVVGLLLRALPCLIYHSEAMMKLMADVPGHAFGNISIFHDVGLMNFLRELVTTEATPGVMVKASGIPPHIGLATQMQTVIKTLTTMTLEFSTQTTSIVDAVNKAIEDKSWENGQVTGTKLKEILDEFQASNMSQLEELRNEFAQIVSERRGDSQGERRGNGVTTRGHGNNATNTYMYGGKFYFVPEDFEFPQVKLREALRFWLKGQSVSPDGSKIVKPFRDLKTSGIPKRLSRDLTVKWLPIMRYLESGAGWDLPEDTVLMSSDAVEEVFTKSMTYLQRTVSYCFKAGKEPSKYTIATWSNRVSRSSIEKYGTAEDKAHLGASSRRNFQKPNQKRRREKSANPRYRKRQEERQARLAAEGQPTQEAYAAPFNADQTGDLLQPEAAAAAAPTPPRRAPAAAPTEPPPPPRPPAPAEDPEPPSETPAAGPHPCSLGARCIFAFRKADHPCYHPNCDQKVHNLCAQQYHLTSIDNELDMYCSEACKSTSPR